MNLPLKTLLAATTLLIANAATPALADVVDARSSAEQGTLVHSDGEEVGTDVTGTLGTGPKQYDFVHFQGTTDAPAPDTNNLHIQGGNGQAQIDGIELGGKDHNANLISGDIFLNSADSGGGTWNDPTNLGMEWIELAFQKGDILADADPSTDLRIFFSLYTRDSNGNPEADPFLFDYALSTSGENKFAFLAINGESIYDLHYNITGGVANALRQVRISSVEGGVPPIPEPATWAMMLLGFGAVGYSMRRRRTTYLRQVA
ncbi:MAG TPA: PEPxxWA-CTERM sorting domain-containing protein [Sphingomicrobium sp.]